MNFPQYSVLPLPLVQINTSSSIIFYCIRFLLAWNNDTTKLLDVTINCYPCRKYLKLFKCIWLSAFVFPTFRFNRNSIISYSIMPCIKYFMQLFFLFIIFFNILVTYALFKRNRIWLCCCCSSGFNNTNPLKHTKAFACRIKDPFSMETLFALSSFFKGVAFGY